jgi:hypothetical protein
MQDEQMPSTSYLNDGLCLLPHSLTGGPIFSLVKFISLPDIQPTQRRLQPVALHNKDFLQIAGA